MAFQTGTSTSLTDLFDDLLTFAVANGWTEDEDTTLAKPALSKGNVFVQFALNSTGASGNRSISIHQALAYVNSSTDPGNHTDDSGNGYNAAFPPTDSNVRQERCVSDIGAGPFTHWFFEDSSPDYIHVVVDIGTNEYRHFGFGNLNKFGNNWTGGEYCYGHYHEGTSPLSVNNTCLLDGFFSATTGSRIRRAATVHMEGLPDQLTSKWGHVWGREATDPPTDSALNIKNFVQGGFRSGPASRVFGAYSGSGAVGNVSLTPVDCFFGDKANNRAYFLGSMPDVRSVNMRNFNPAQTVSIGGDDWLMFPTTIRSLSTPSLSSGVQGIAYKKVT